MGKRKTRPTPVPKPIPKVKAPPVPVKLGDPTPPNWKFVGDAQELREVFPSPDRDKKSYQSYWSSPEAFARYIATLKESEAWHDSAWTQGNKEWYGTSNMEEALKMAQEGWTEGTKKASRLLNRIRAKYPLQKKPKKYAVVGAYPNVPKAIAGNPLNMVVPDPHKASSRPIITLLSNIGAHCDHDGDEFLNRASVVAAIVDQIEAAGYACDVIAYVNSQAGWFGMGNMRVRSCIQVKNSNQPVDINRLAFGLGHPAMFRRLVFAEKGHDRFCSELGSGLGCQEEMNKEGLAERNIFVLPSINDTYDFKTEADAETKGMKYIVDALKEQGFPLFQEEEFKLAA